MSGIGKTIIAVDDEAENRLLVKGILEREGYIVFGAEGGLECLALLARVVPRLILMDIQMPGMDGFNVCRRVRQNQILQHVPIVFLTACKTLDEVREGMAAGGNDFVLKPVRSEPLVERVKHWTSRSLRDGFRNPLAQVI